MLKVSFPVVVAVVLLSPLASILCSSVGSVSGQLPADVKEQILEKHGPGGFCPECTRNVRLEVLGPGKLSPLDRNMGVDKVVCVKVYSEVQYTDGTWRDIVDHILAKRTGDYWDVGIYYGNVTERDWKEHSCPGQHEPSGR